MKYLYAVGGQQRKNAQDRGEWHAYQKAVVLRIRPDTGSVETCLEYQSPRSVCADLEPSIVFKAGWLEGQELYLCTETEVLIYRLPTFERIGYVSLPCFNDVHHVLPTPQGNLLVACTGLDLVVEVTRDGRILREWSAIGEDTWSRFSRQTDYRKVPTTKPHKSHPNYVFYLDDEIWVTRFEQRDAVCLTRSGLRIDIGAGRVHDGIVVGDRVYFTIVDGMVAMGEAGAKAELIDLNQIDVRESALGWCRGLWLEGDRAWVGFSRFRPTKFRENLSWIKHGFEKVGIYKTLPTRIASYDLVRKQLLREIDLEPHGLNAVFCILGEG